jgi:hypothetical protein
MAKATESTVKPTVVSFRITAKQQKMLDAIQDNDPVVGIDSRNQYARKILSDFLAGRLEYKNPKDRLGDLDSVG